MKKMLIVEDDQIVGNIYRHKFQVEGFQVALATDGEAGLTAVKEIKPDVVILDLMLPKLNGVEILKKMRAEPTTKSIPVIVLSNAYLSSLVQEAWKAGANHCMIKASCTPKQLVELVNRTLGAPPAVGAPAPDPTLPKSAQATASAAIPAKKPRPPGSLEDDTAFQTELRQTFLGSAPNHVDQLRGMLQTFIKSAQTLCDTREGLPALFDASTSFFMVKVRALRAA